MAVWQICWRRTAQKICLNLIYNPDPDNQADEVVLVLDEFLATNDLDDITLTQIELL